jgi:hypothetical protein
VSSAQRRRRRLGELAMNAARELAIARALRMPEFRIGHVDVSRDALGRIHETVNVDVLFVPEGARAPGAADRAVFGGAMQMRCTTAGTFYVREQDVVRPHLHCWALSMDEHAQLSCSEVLEAGMPARPRSRSRSARREPAGGPVELADAVHLVSWLQTAFPSTSAARLPVPAGSAALLAAFHHRVVDAARAAEAAIDVTRAEAAALEEADAAAHGFGEYGALVMQRAFGRHPRPCMRCARLAGLYAGASIPASMTALAGA